MAVTVIRHKRGDTFDFQASVTDGKSGPPVDITGWIIRSEIRNASQQLIAELIATIIDAEGGLYSLVSDGPTTEWPVGNAFMDIEYTESGIIKSTETISVQIIRDETLPATP